MNHSIDCKPFLNAPGVTMNRVLKRETLASNSLNLINVYEIQDIVSVSDKDGWNGQLINVFFWELTFYKGDKFLGRTFKKIENI